MSELAPGVFVHSWVPAGQVFIIDTASLDLGFGSGGRGVAISTETWERIPGADRERLLDELTRADAERGQRLLAGYLAEHPPEQ